MAVSCMKVLILSVSVRTPRLSQTVAFNSHLKVKELIISLQFFHLDAVQDKDFWKSKAATAQHTYISFAGWEVRLVKNYGRGLENAARGRIFKPSVTVFHHTDRP